MPLANTTLVIAMLVAKRMSENDFVGYVISQCLGAIAGSGILCLFFGFNASLGQNGYGSASALGTSVPVAFVVEVVLTFTFVLGVTSRDFKCAGLVIGLALKQVWLFILAPLVGGVLAALVYPALDKQISK